ncbi:MAG: hypothetical protein AMJ91_06915 [candidate division Zixibacteria bacterium SM23_73_3]|nr:MAG: hypothetical protein AMJ91_06915 [candidate division Zixibacteria bacterium SM23_73_3]
MENKVRKNKAMKKLTLILLLLITFEMLSPKFVYTQEELGLIIIAHGSPMAQWNIPVLELEEEVKRIMSERNNNPFNEIRVALMEFNEPSINTAIKDLENAGVDKVYAITLFIAPSGHSLYDIPTILGLYSDKEMIERIKEEGTTTIDTKMKITIGPSLNVGEVLKEVMLDRVGKLSTTPDSEGVVLLAHGDARFEPIWGSVCREIGSYICAGTGINYFDYAFVEIGQSFILEGAPVILKTADKCKKTIVVGLYLAMSVEDMAQNSILDVGEMKIESKEIFAGKKIHFSKQSILPDKRISEWIVDRALEWAERMK